MSSKVFPRAQVTRSVDTERGKLSPQEQKTVDAIVEARWKWSSYITPNPHFTLYSSQHLCIPMR